MDRRYPLILIDDEPLAREAVSRLLSEKFPGFELVGEADSGPGGVSLFRELQPSIVIMDIQIPGFDGLEASRVILRESPDAQIIVLSAYDDFRYAQDALHDGILGYLLKPVREDRLGEMLEKAVNGILMRESMLQEKKEIRTYRSMAVREQVASFIYGSKGGIPAEDFATLSDPPINKGYFIVFRLIDDSAPDRDDTRLLHQQLDRMNGLISGEWMGNHLPVFVPMNAVDKDSWRSGAEFLCREIGHQMRDILKCRVKAGVGPIETSPSAFADSFHSAFDALEEDCESRLLVFHSGSTEHHSGHDSYPVEGEKVFLEACRASDARAAMKAAVNLADDLINPDASLMDSRFAVTEFLIIFRREWERISSLPHRRTMANLLREALLCADHAILREWFLLVVRDLTGTLSDDAGGDDFLLRKVRHFIDLNDLKDVSLEYAAESVGITGSYLSRLFKEKTGRNFHDYVVERRLDTAAGLLRETNLPVQDISHKIGYGDVTYFSRIFRKRFGSSPREYRKSPS